MEMGNNTRRLHLTHAVAMINIFNACPFLETYVNPPSRIINNIIINTSAKHNKIYLYNIHKHADELHTKYGIKIYEMEKNELNCGKGCEPERQWELWVIH